MKWDNIKDKIQNSELNTLFAKKALWVTPIVIICTVLFVNFTSSETTECPTILSYDEIKETISIVYCKTENNSFQIEAVHKSGMLCSESIQYTIDGNTFIRPCHNPGIMVEELPDYLLLNLIYKSSCIQNNTPDVSFPISKIGVENCHAKEQSYTSKDSKMQYETMEITKPSNESVNNYTEKSKTVNYSISSVERKIEKEDFSKNEIVQPAIVQTKKDIVQNSTKKAPVKSHYKKRELPTTSSAPEKTIVVPVAKENNVVTPAKIILTEKEDAFNTVSPPQHANEPTDLASTDLASTDLASIDDLVKTESSSVLITKSESVATPISSSLFNSQDCGILKSCIYKSNKIKAKTDLFTISIKPESSITLYDIYCHATNNSHITLTLSQLGKPIKTFSVALNKGENQIGLSSFGALDMNQAYLLEFQTTNKGDLYQFPDCLYSSSSENGLVLRYLDDHSALFGLTYETEIE